VKVLLFLGYSGSGKTTALTAIAKGIVRRRLGKVGTLKHIHHYPNFTIDTKGKDTWLHAKAGASVVISIAPRELTIIKKEPGAESMSFDQILAIFRRDKVDYVLVEGLYRKFSMRRGVSKIICASSEKQALDLLKEHGQRNVVCITGKVADSLRVREIVGVPALRITSKKDLERILDKLQ